MAAKWHETICHLAEVVMAGMDDPAAGETQEVAAFRRSLRQGRSGSYDYFVLLGLAPENPMKILLRVEKGLGYHSFERFQRSAGLSALDLAEAVSITPRTLHRRKEEGRLAPDESDRLLRVSRVFGRALALFEGDADAAREWLAGPQAGLGGQRPIALARTDLGAREVEALVDRLEHGVLA
jgi:putative toxin-antitoxin system antitoxin component (TIGR02293 family)